MAERLHLSNDPDFMRGQIETLSRKASERIVLLALLRDVRDWLDSPGGEPDSGVLLDRINAALSVSDFTSAVPFGEEERA